MYIWFFDPESLHAVKHVRRKGNVVIYDQVDFHGIYDDKGAIDVSSHHFVNSKILLHIYSSNSSRIKLVPQGFSEDFFQKHLSLKKSNNLKIRKRPRIGFIGHIGFRLDYDLLINLIRSRPEWDFVFFGKKLVFKDFGAVSFVDSFYQTTLKMNQLFKYSNTLWDEVDKQKIPEVIETFDVCIIPYNNLIEFNRFCFPMKLFEYFYMGKPVVATPIEELKRFPSFVKIGSTFEEWGMLIDDLLKNSWTKELIRQQRSVARSNSWKKKISLIESTIYH